MYGVDLECDVIIPTLSSSPLSQGRPICSEAGPGHVALSSLTVVLSKASLEPKGEQREQQGLSTLGSPGPFAGAGEKWE